MTGNSIGSANCTSVSICLRMQIFVLIYCLNIRFVSAARLYGRQRDCCQVGSLSRYCDSCISWWFWCIASYARSIHWYNTGMLINDEWCRMQKWSWCNATIFPEDLRWPGRLSVATRCYYQLQNLCDFQWDIAMTFDWWVGEEWWFAREGGMVMA